jgi:hypothetical protein
VVTVPTAPGPFKITSWTNVRVNGKATANSTGGDDILEWQLAWGTHPTVANATGNLNSDGTGFVTGLVPGGTYYFWNRQRNSAGWSALSAMTQVTMKDVPDPPKIPSAFSNKTQTSVNILVAPNGNGGVPITSYELAYGQSPASTDVSIEQQSGLFHLTDLEPGEGYYLWAKAKNVYGESAWSARGAVVLIAGAWVKQGLIWRRAVPYVRVGGVWKMARSWNKVQGVWKEGQD